MNILAFDPGTEKTGWAVYDGQQVISAGIMANADVLRELDPLDMKYTEIGKLWSSSELLAIEMIACIGKPVGKEVFETCVWIGRFVQQSTIPYRFIYRSDVKLHICGSMRANDSKIRQALINKIGSPGTKKAPGPTYGVTSHAWSALAVAVTAAEAPKCRK